MAKNQSTYTLKIDAELGNLQQTLNEAKNSLSNFMASGNAPKGLEKAFEKINTLLGQITDKAGKPLDLKGLNAAGRDLDSVQESFHAIIRLLGEFDDLSDDIKLSFLSDDEQKKVKAASNALLEYSKVMEEVAKKQKLLEAAQKTNEKDKAALGKAKKKVSGLEDDRTLAQAKLSGAQNKLAAARNSENANPKDIAKYEAEVEKLTAELAILEKNLNEANIELDAAQTTYNESAQSVKKLGAEIKRASGNSLKQLKEEAVALGISLDGLNGHGAAAQVEILTNRLEEFKREAMSGAQPAFEAIKRGCQNAEKSVNGLQDELKEGVEAVKGMDEAAAQREAFEGKIKQFLGLSGAAQVMRAALRDAMQTITELDATMTEMAVVTDLGVSDYWNQLPEYTARANELGLAINDVYKADTLFYQQGLKTNEVVEISTETMKMARIAGLDTAEAIDRMTAALRGFNMELNEASAQKVSDVYSQLAAITAADVEEISSAMTKTASIASSAGMEFETTAAFLAQIVETTRESAETAGTAMKTVIARFQELKKDPSEIGEVDGEIVDANKIETALRSVGVALRDSSGQFRELDDVFLELSSKWSGLDKNTQRYIATIAAGSRQQSRFIAMMSDYGRTQELVTAANNSAGASAKQFEKTQESLSAKMEKLKNTWHEFTMGIMNSDLIKVGVDILTKFLEIINKATDGLGDNGFGGALMKIAGVFAIFKMGMKIFNKFETPIMSLFKKVTEWAGVEGFKAGKTYTEAAERGAQSAANNESGNENDNEEGDGNSNNENQSPKKPLKKRLTEITGIDNIKEGLNKKKNKRNEILTNKDQQATARREQANSKYTEALAKQAEAQKQGEEQYKKAIEETKRARQECEDAEREYQSRLELTEDEQKQVTEAGKEGWQQLGKGIGQAGQALTGVGMGMSMIGGLLSSLGLETAGSVISDIGQAITMVGGALMVIPPIISAIQAIMAAPPLGIILIILAAVAAIVATIVIISNKLSLANRMKEAAEATEEAKKAAEEAKEAYDKLLSDKNKYDELQTALENLTYGTKEWKQALVEANQQVLELLQTYSGLAGYLTRGEDGQLAISDEGWDSLIENQQKAISNTRAIVISRQLDEQKLKIEAEMSDFNNKATVMREDGYGNTYVDTAATRGLTEDLTDLYLVQGDSLVENEKRVEELAQKYRITSDQIWNAASALEANKNEIEAIALETENIARASLTAMASDKVSQSEFGEATIDAFAVSQTGDYYQSLVSARADELYSKDGGSEFKNNEEFKSLASEYGVTAEMTGNDLHDLEALYKAMAGVEDIPDSLEGNKEELVKAIAEMDVANSQSEKMDDYVNKLEKLSQEDQNNLAGIFSQSGTGMSADYAQNLLTTSDSGETVLNTDALLNEAKKLGYNSIEEWASALNKSVEDFQDEAEKNARNTIIARSRSFEKLNRVLGNTEGKIQKLGETTQLSAGQEENLVKKITNVASVSGSEIASGVTDALGRALDSVGEDADELADYLGNMNWQDMGSWEELPEVLSNLGISWTTEVKAFVRQAQSAAKAIKIIDFKELNEQLKSTYDLLQSIKSGEQNREFKEEDYKSLVASNKDLAKDFVQMGDKYVYVGKSMNDLTDALEKNTVANMREAGEQLAAKKEVASVANSFSTSFGGKELSTDLDYSNWNESELIHYLEEFQKKAYQTTFGENGTKDENALNYLDDKGLGLSFTTDFREYDKTDLLAMMKMIDTNADNEVTLDKESKKLFQDSLVMSYTLNNTATQNLALAKEKRDQGSVEEAQLYSRAVLTQAAESGIVAEAIMSRYSELSDKENLTEDEAAELEKLEQSMTSSLGKIIDNQKGIEALTNLQNQVAEALYDSRQKEIDKLSDINESVQSAGGTMINKLQKQIDETRKQRQKDKAAQNIADLQNKQAYLSMDSSGTNSLELLSLNQQIAEAEQSYQDTLIDQALQDLSDANDQAAEQRERQINILQAQLDYEQSSGQIMDQAVALVNDSLNQINSGTAFESTIIGTLLTSTEKWSKLSEEQQALQLFELLGLTADAAEIVKSSENTQTNTTNLSKNSATETTVSSIDNLVKTLAEEREMRKASISSGAQALIAKDSGGWAHRESNTAYTKARDEFVASGGSVEQFESSVRNELSKDENRTRAGTDLIMTNKKGYIVSGTFPGTKITGWHDAAAGDWDDDITITFADGSQVSGITILDKKGVNNGEHNNEIADSETSRKLTELSGGNPSDQWVAMYNSIPYIYRQGKWVRVHRNPDNDTYIGYDNLKTAMLKQLNGYETGGLADFTGPAWLDGTKSRPEYVLNAAQTERFFSLVDILEGIDEGETSKKSSGDNYFDINIQVEKLENDYDVEQVADKIRRMIYEDASYRNVNALNLIR